MTSAGAKAPCLYLTRLYHIDKVKTIYLLALISLFSTVHTIGDIDFQNMGILDILVIVTGTLSCLAACICYWRDRNDR